MRNKLVAFLLIVALLACTAPVNAGRRGPYRPNLKDFQRELQIIGGDNLIGYWPLDDTSGVRARDLLERLGPELVTNGDFSAWSGGDAVGWDEYRGDTAEETIEVHGGASSCKFTVTGGESNGAIASNPSTTKGKLYRLSAWLKMGDCTHMIFKDLTTNVSTGNVTPGVYTEYVLYVTSESSIVPIVYIYGDGTHAYIDDVSVREVTRGEYLDITGTTLGQKGPPGLGRSHYFDGLTDYNSAHVYLDETGANWGPDVHGISLVDGNAFVRTDGVDLSPFAGTEGSDTPYMLVLTDDSDKVAWGYIGNQEATEELDTELITNGTAWTGATGATPPNDWDSAVAAVHTIFDSGDGAPYNACLKLEHDGASNNPRIADPITTVVGKLYRVSVAFKHGTANYGAVRIGTTSGGVELATIAMTDASWTTHVIYFTAVGTTTYISLMSHSSTGGQFELFDTVSIKEVLHPGTDAVHIVSTRDGSTRNWAGIDGAFEFNDSAYTFEVRSTKFQITGALTLGAWIKTADTGTIIAKYRNLVAESAFRLTIAIAGGAALRTTLGNANKTATGSVDLRDNEWHHIVGVFIPSISVTIFVDGVQAAQNTTTIIASMNDCSVPVTVGMQGDASNFLAANESHAFIMDKAITAAQVKRLYDIGARTHGG